MTANAETRTEAMRVSTIELFFDLVFVFTITQVTHLVEHVPTVWELGLVLVAALVDPKRNWVLLLAAALLFVTATMLGRERNFTLRADHFAERHGAVVLSPWARASSRSAAAPRRRARRARDANDGRAGAGARRRRRLLVFTPD